MFNPNHLPIGEGVDVVVLGVSPLSRAYYASGEPPATCWSQEGIVPHDYAPTLTGVTRTQPQAKRCMDCTKSIRGTSGPKGTACKYNQRLAVVIADQWDEVYQLYLSPASIFGGKDSRDMPWQKYTKYLTGNNSLPTDVVTHVYRDPHSVGTKLFFRPARPLLEEDLKALASVDNRTAVIRALEFSVPPPADNPFGIVDTPSN